MTLQIELAKAKYASMSNQEAADSLNLKDIPRIRSAMSGDELFSQTNATEFLALTDANKQMWVSFCARDVINPASVANVDFVKHIFGFPFNRDTVDSLEAARNEMVSQATELGLPRIRVGLVEEARR